MWHTEEPRWRREVCRTIPYPRNDSFVARYQIFDQLERLLPPRNGYQNAALWGLGGSGKTQIALEYAYRRCSDPNCSVFWVNAYSEISFAQDYKRIAQKLDLEDSLNGEELLVAVRNRVETLPQWVFILDGADDLTLFEVGRGSRATTESSSNLSAYVPTGGTVLWTSRDQRIVGSLVGLRRGIEVASMTNNEASMLFESVPGIESQDERQAVAQLVVALDGIPLAIVQAVSYIHRTMISSVQYLKLFQKTESRRKLLNSSVYDSAQRSAAPNSVLRTWGISMDYIRIENRMAYDILSVLAYTDRFYISFEMLVKIAQAKADQDLINSDDQEGSQDSDYTTISTISGSDTVDSEYNTDLEDAVARLQQFSFLSLRSSAGDQSLANRFYDMHRLVQEAVLYKLHMQDDSKQEEISSARIAFEVTDNLFPDIWQRDTWDRCNQYLGHAYRTGQWAHLYGAEILVARLLSKVSRYLHDRGRWREKEPVDQMALQLRQMALGEQDCETLRSMASLATTLHQRGIFEEAENIFEKVLQLRRAILGDEDPETIETMANLAATYANQGRDQDAEDLKVGVLKVRRRVLGARHLDTIESLAELAASHHNRGDYSEAKRLIEKVIELRQAVLGDNDPETLRSMASLVVVLHCQKDYTRAEDLCLRILAARKETLGDRHPDTAQTIASLATIYDAQQKYALAEDAYIGALALRTELLGENHPDTIHSIICFHKFEESQKKHDDYLVSIETGLKSSQVRDNASLMRFNGPIKGGIVIAGVHADAGGTNNFNFSGSYDNQQDEDTTKTLLRYGLLDSITATTIVNYTNQLLADIREVSSDLKSSRTADVRDVQNAIKVILDKCAKDLGRSPWTKTCFANFGDLNKLRDEMGRKLSDLLSLLSHDERTLSVVHQRTSSAAQDLCDSARTVQHVIRSLLGYVSLCSMITMPGKMPHSVVEDLEPIILYDASRYQDRIAIPPRFCVSKEAFHNLLRILFSDQPWHAKIDREEYELEGDKSMAVVTADNWKKEIRPGAALIMSMICNFANTPSEETCLGCGASDIVKIYRWNKCGSCGLLSDLTETDRVIESLDENNEDFIDSHSAQSSTADGQIGSMFSNAETTDKANQVSLFSRIRYVHEHTIVRDRLQNKMSSKVPRVHTVWKW